jgi:hypothetical protein
MPHPRQLIEETQRRAEQPTSLRFGEYDYLNHPSSYGDEGHATFAADAALYSMNAALASEYAACASSVTLGGYEEDYGRYAVAPTLPGYVMERAAQADLLRDIIGPAPFRPLPPLPPSVRAWNDGLVVKLATSIYQERSLPEGTLDVRRMGVLADALEEAGCTNDAILGHLRGPGPNYRGCHVLDAILEKE